MVRRVRHPAGAAGETLIVTATTEQVTSGLSLDPEAYRSVKVMVKERQVEKTIQLLDSAGSRFTFDGDGHYEVFDREEARVVDGSITSDEEITVQEDVTTPFTVELEVDQTFYTFYGEEAGGEGEEEAAGPEAELEGG